mmetsp:Transcript_24768/g.62279  ORF Transcript_24768/g.62279 Transcript_24768/m.62279 type:complete len:230 (-) Transcript_24768:17-706(-)
MLCSDFRNGVSSHECFRKVVLRCRMSIMASNFFPNCTTRGRASGGAAEAGGSSCDFVWHKARGSLRNFVSDDSGRRASLRKGVVVRTIAAGLIMILRGLITASRTSSNFFPNCRPTRRAFADAGRGSSHAPAFGSCSCVRGSSSTSTSIMPLFRDISPIFFPNCATRRASEERETGIPIPPVVEGAAAALGGPGVVFSNPSAPWSVFATSASPAFSFSSNPISECTRLQ